MASKMTIAGFPDVLDSRFRRMADGGFTEEKDMIGTFYSTETPTQSTERISGMTPMGLHSAFTGLIASDSPEQSYDVTAAFKEFALMTQIERALLEYDNFKVIDGRYKYLGRSANETRQVHAARIFNQAFTNDTDSGIGTGFYVHSEAVALCSDAHTTTKSGVSTTSGFDNAGTAALSKTALLSGYIQFRKFKNLAGQPIGAHEANALVVPVDLKDKAEELVGTIVGLDSADQNKNVLKGRYNVIDWIRITDVNNWFLVDQSEMKDNLIWMDKVKKEFEREKDMQTKVALYSSYMIYHILRGPAWQWCYGSAVG